MAILTKIELREQVESELQWDPQVTPAGIGVTAHHGVVTLTGDVPSYAAKLAAERAALRVHGVKTVANELHVKLATERNDVDIAADTAKTLQVHVNVPPTVKASVRDGFVTLEGSVPWMYQKTAAEAAVRNLHGVRGLANLIAIKPHVSERVVQTRIEDALRRSAELDASHIRVLASGKTVTLSGRVRSFAERVEAERAAWAALGVANVDNRIEVAP
jgi:osmotically-inducible protein OsmY